MLGCVHWIEIGLSITWYAFFITLDDQFFEFNRVNSINRLQRTNERTNDRHQKIKTKQQCNCSHLIATIKQFHIKSYVHSHDIHVVHTVHCDGNGKHATVSNTQAVNNAYSFFELQIEAFLWRFTLAFSILSVNCFF